MSITKAGIRGLVSCAAVAVALLSAPARSQQTPAANPDAPWANKLLSADERARLIVDQMTLDEQIQLMRTDIGFGLLSLGVPLPETLPESMRRQTPEGALGTAGFIAAIPRLGVPAQHLADATLGVANLGGFLRKGDEATSLPATLALAASFDPALAREAGRMLGSEARAKGFNIQLAGGVNLTREARNGRNFEYVGEDPLLAGLIAGEQIAGIQDKGVVSTTKHYAVNFQESGRGVYDSRMSEGAMRESDLLAFEIANARGRPGSVMCAYNRVNGAYSCENDFLLNKVLKGDWGFTGYVMSDWGAVHSLEASIQSGLDQESPQDRPYFGGLKAAVEAGRISRERVADSARRIVRTLIDVGVYDNPPRPGGTIDRDANADVAEKVALNGIVLLKNDGILPVAATARKIVVIGGFADRGVLSGGGSSQVMPYGGHFLDTRGKQGFQTIFSPVYGLSSPLDALRKLRPDAEIGFDDGTDPARAAQLASKADLAVVFVTRPEDEGHDSKDLLLPHDQDALIAAVAKANRRTAVVLETGNPTAMPWLPQVGAVLQAWYPGQRGGQAVARILTGDVNPSGRLPMTFPASVDQTPRPAIPGQAAVSDAPFGFGSKIEPYAVDLTEGSDVGYRWFDRTGAKPLFPFGYGLSYTSFAYSGARFAGGTGVKAKVTLTNRGKRPGIETAQLYVAPPGRTHRLAGWARVALAPGESRTVEIAADPRILASWDDGAKGWRRAGGSYRLFVGRSAGQPEALGEVRVTASADIPRTIEGDAAPHGK